MGPNCLTCHQDNYLTPTHLAAGNAPGAEIADGHKIAGTDLGPKTKFDGSQGVTLDWESEVATSSYAIGPAGNPLAGQALTTGQEGTVATTWTFPTQSVFWARQRLDRSVDRHHGSDEQLRHHLHRLPQSVSASSTARTAARSAGAWIPTTRVTTPTPS